MHGAFLHARADPAVATLRLLRSRLAVLGRLMWGPQAPPGGGGAAAAAAEAAKASGGSNLYPPRDKKARKLWHDLQIFKKKSDKGMKSRELLLPPDTGYMRACAHHYAQLLGMTTATQGEGQERAVMVKIVGETAHEAASKSAGSATGAPDAAAGTRTSCCARHCGGAVFARPLLGAPLAAASAGGCAEHARWAATHRAASPRAARCLDALPPRAARHFCSTHARGAWQVRDALRLSSL